MKNLPDENPSNLKQRLPDAISIDAPRGGYEKLYLFEKVFIFSRNLLFMIFSILSALLYMPLIYAMYFVVDLVPFSMEIKSVMNSYLKIFSHHFLLAIVSFLVPSKIYIAQDTRIPDLDKGIIISNHLSDFDWLFILHYFQSIGKLQHLSIIIKESFSKTPFIGYILKKMGHAFVKRTEDSGSSFQGFDSLRKRIETINKMAQGFMLIFPEGAFQHRSSIEKSIRHLEKYPYVFEDKLYVPDNVLTPRETGFNIIYEVFDSSEGIIDLTIIPNPFTKRVGIFKNIVSHLLFGTREINFVIVADYVEKGKFKESPRYLQELFSRKDKLIARFEKLTLEKSEKGSDPYKISSTQDLENLLLGHLPNSNYDYGSIEFYSPYWAIFAPIFILLFYFLAGFLIGNAIKLFSKQFSSN